MERHECKFDDMFLKRILTNGIGVPAQRLIQPPRRTPLGFLGIIDRLAPVTVLRDSERDQYG